MNEDYTVLKEENRLLKARIFDFRIQLELILEKPSEELKTKERFIKEIIQESVELSPYVKHDLTEYIDEEYKVHPMLQLYDNFFGLNNYEESKNKIQKVGEGAEPGNSLANQEPDRD